MKKKRLYLQNLLSLINKIKDNKEYQNYLNKQLEESTQKNKITAKQDDAGLILTPNIDVKTDPQDGSFLVKGVVEKIIYFDRTSFFTVLAVKVLDFTDTDQQVPDKIRMIGTAKNVNEGDIVRARGKLEKDKRKGLSFNFDNKIEHILPVAEKSLVSFLVRHVTGLGDKIAKRILDRFGLNAIDIIQYNPKLLVTDLGLSKTKAQEIVSQLADPAKYNDLLVFLKTNDFDLNLADNLYEDFGSSAVNKIRNNPYILSNYKNVSFRHLDRIGFQKGFYARDYRRFAAAMSLYLKQRVARGNTVTDYRRFYAEFDEKSGISGKWMSHYSAFPPLVDEMVQQKQVDGSYRWVATGRKVTSTALDNNTFLALVEALIKNDYLSGIKMSEINTAALYLRDNEKIETHIVDTVFDRVIHNKANSDVRAGLIDDLLDEYEDHCNIKLADMQRKAVHAMIHHRLVNITGGAGFGKTTLVAAFIYVFSNLTHELNEDELEKVIAQASKEHHCDEDNIVYKQIALASPTGKAAHNLMTDTGYPAFTIHKLLKIKPGNTNANTLQQSKHYLVGDYLIVDESSMIDEQLFNTILYALDRKMNLVLIGDPNQLPSVGAGKVFKDLIDSKLVPTIKLTQVFRQDEKSIIFQNDQAILHGLGTNHPNGTEFTSDLSKSNVFLDVANQQDIPNVLRDTVQKLISDQGYALDDIMVLTPKHQGTVGTMQENLLLQQTINPNYAKLNEAEKIIDQWIKEGKKEKAETLSNFYQDLSYNSIFGKTYYVGDRMLQLKNDYTDSDNEVMNGSVGHITKINFDKKTKRKKGFTVEFPEDGAVKTYEKMSDFKNIDLGYAFTVHKAQGSGSPVVICIVDWSANNMLDRTLLYTAATRAKEKMIFIGQKSLFNQAIQRVNQRNRDTALAIRLRIKYLKWLKQNKDKA